MNDRKIKYYQIVPVFEPEPHKFDLNAIATAAVVTCAATGEHLDGMGGGGTFISKHVFDHLTKYGDLWRDKDDEFTTAIHKAHPVIDKSDDKRWDRNLMAREMINHRHSKASLIDLTHWLLTRAQRAEKALAAIVGHISAALNENVQRDEIIFSGDDEAVEVITFVRSIADMAETGLETAPKVEEAKAA